MIVTYTRSFDKSLKKSGDKESAKQSVEALILALQHDIQPQGLGLKKLRDDIWEIRISLKTRVLFALFPGEIRFLLTGDHDEVKDFLKNA